MAFETDSIEEALKLAESKGLQLIDKELSRGPRDKGGFHPPQSTFGIGRTRQEGGNAESGYR